MDERLKKALEYSNYMVTYNNQKRILKQKFLDQNVHYANGSKFKINREFITFINLLLQISDFAKFVDDVMNIYSKNVNDYYTQLHKIKKRDIKDVLGR